MQLNVCVCVASYTIKLVGKAQEVCTSLTIEDILNDDTVKATILPAYELVPKHIGKNGGTVNKLPPRHV